MPDEIPPRKEFYNWLRRTRPCTRLRGHLWRAWLVRPDPGDEEAFRADMDRVNIPYILRCLRNDLGPPPRPFRTATIINCREGSDFHELLHHLQDDTPPPTGALYAVSLRAVIISSAPRSSGYAWIVCHELTHAFVHGLYRLTSSARWLDEAYSIAMEDRVIVTWGHREPVFRHMVRWYHRLTRALRPRTLEQIIAETYDVYDARGDQLWLFYCQSRLLFDYLMSLRHTRPLIWRTLMDILRSNNPDPKRALTQICSATQMTAAQLQDGFSAHCAKLVEYHRRRSTARPSDLPFESRELLPDTDHDLYSAADIPPKTRSRWQILARAVKFAAVVAVVYLILNRQGAVRDAPQRIAVDEHAAIVTSLLDHQRRHGSLDGYRLSRVRPPGVPVLDLAAWGHPHRIMIMTQPLDVTFGPTILTYGDGRTVVSNVFGREPVNGPRLDLPALAEPGDAARDRSAPLLSGQP